MATTPGLLPGNRRRSERVLIRVPVRINGITRQGRHVAEKGEAVIISRHGALLKTGNDLQPGTEVDLENPTTHETAKFRVVWASDRPADGRWDIGLEFAAGNANLWGIGLPLAGAEAR